ncbi:MAG: alcohol dehydrogenase catalytic domain-containing protein [Pseudomonadota bacterium]
MRALVYVGPGNLRLRELDAPEAAGETLVDVAFCGICGSDMHAFLGHDERRPAPLTLGHEAAGTTRDGERVVVNPLVTCMACEACDSGRENLCPKREIISMPPRQGAFADVVRLPRRNLLPIPQHFPLEKAALTEPLACGWHAARLAEFHSRAPLDSLLGARRPLILGGGAIGLASALALVANGAKGAVISEPNKRRWSAIRAAGPFEPVLPEDTATLSPPVVVDAFGSGRTRAQASAQVAPGGVVVHVGLSDAAPGLDTRRATLQEVAFVGAYTYTAAEFAETLQAMVAGRLGKLDWIEVRPIDEGAAAFKALRDGRVETAKIILAMN